MSGDEIRGRSQSDRGQIFDPFCADCEFRSQWTCDLEQFELKQ